jgi:hypothetical protein
VADQQIGDGVAQQPGAIHQPEPQHGADEHRQQRFAQPVAQLDQVRRNAGPEVAQRLNTGQCFGVGLGHLGARRRVADQHAHQQRNQQRRADQE